MDTAQDVAWLVAPVLGLMVIGASVALQTPCKRNNKTVPDETAEPRWELFCVSNVIAVATFAASVGYLVSSGADLRAHPRTVLTSADPRTVMAFTGALASVVYFMTFSGVAVMHAALTSNRSSKDDRDVATKRALQADVARAVAKATGMLPVAIGAQSAAAASDGVDVDVLIIGMGTAGAALASVLARQGKKVAVIERNMNQIERIVGELLQPGGVRALERMGLSQCAKSAYVDSVRVDGYVCLTPSTDCKSDLILSYPNHDPASLVEYVGLAAREAGSSGSSTPVVRMNKEHGDLPGTVHVTESISGNTAPSVRDKLQRPAMPTGSDTEVDEKPRGRSFYNHLFVHELRLVAMEEPNVRVHIGRATQLVSAAEVRSGEAYGAPEAGSDKCWFSSSGEASAAVPSACTFKGFDSEDRSISRDCTGVKVNEETMATLCSRTAGRARAPVEAAKGSKFFAQQEADAVGGVRWVDEDGIQRVTTARLTVVADGMYSALRTKLHDHRPQTVSHFCGLILHHPPHQPPLPYPNRGHVIMADPSPVLLYQISPTQTRVLVDVLGHLPSVEDGSLRRYFLEKVAPQLPEMMRPAFIHAAETQEPDNMPNRRLTSTSVRRAGALLLGDSLNMRHPLTGGGMTVALKDVEMLSNCLDHLHGPACPPKALDAAADIFYSTRGTHSATINILANALHRVFSVPAAESSPDSSRARLRAACVAYMSMGGLFAAGPIGLLSGLTPKPGVLVSHFFAVAAHAMRMAVCPVPTPGKLLRAYDLLRVACVIILPLLEAEKATFMSSKPVLGFANALFPWRDVQL